MPNNIEPSTDVIPNATNNLVSEVAINMLKKGLPTNDLIKTRRLLVSSQNLEIIGGASTEHSSALLMVMSKCDMKDYQAQGDAFKSFDLDSIEQYAGVKYREANKAARNAASAEAKRSDKFR